MVWCGVVWCGVVWCAVLWWTWCGMVRALVVLDSRFMGAKAVLIGNHNHDLASYKKFNLFKANQNPGIQNTKS